MCIVSFPMKNGDFPYSSISLPEGKSNVAIGNPLEIGVSIGKPPIHSVYSIAMFDCRRVSMEITMFNGKVN